jgi:hypothetical protein
LPTRDNHRLDATRYGTITTQALEIALTLATRRWARGVARGRLTRLCWAVRGVSLAWILLVVYIIYTSLYA